MNASQTLVEQVIEEAAQQSRLDAIAKPDLLATIARDAATNSRQYVDDATVPHGGE